MNLYNPIIQESDITIDHIPSVVPLLTFDEYCNLTHNPHDLTAVEYLFMHEDSNLVIGREINTLNSMCDSISEYNSLLELGWKPGVEFNDQILQYARERQLEYFKEHCVNIIDCTEDLKIPLQEEASEYQKAKNAKLSPIFIVLLFEPSPAGIVIKIWGLNKNWKYIHSGLALDSSLSTIYTFLLSGMSTESLARLGRNKMNAIKVMALFVTKTQREQIKKAIRYYIDNKEKTSYSFKNIAKIMFNIGDKKSAYSMSMICSEFVDALLKGANIDISGKDSSLTAPEDLGANTDKANVFIVFEGAPGEYNPEAIDKKCAELQATLKYKDLNAVKTKSDREAIAKQKEATQPEKKNGLVNLFKKKDKVEIKQAEVPGVDQSAPIDDDEE